MKISNKNHADTYLDLQFTNGIIYIIHAYILQLACLNV